MSNFTFRGTATALITPFDNEGAIDFSAFENIIEFQIASGIEAIVVCGSTGENPTLTSKEKVALIQRAVEIADKRIGVIVGTGSNETHCTVDWTNIAKEHGADAALIVAPYYNKPSQNGLFEHFRLIANEVKFPIFLYNIPGRTGVNIQPATQIALANECKNIVGVKEASGNMDQIMTIIKDAPKGFSVFSGDDNLAASLIAVGASGVISTISNYAPKQYGDLVRAALNGDFTTAKRLHYQLFELMELNFVRPNPEPAKAIMNLLDFCENVLRMPLLPVESDDDLIPILTEALKNAKIKPYKKIAKKK